MRALLVLTASLLLAAPAAAAEPVAWEDPCGDAARAVTAADQRQAAPGREGLDLREVAVLAEPAAVTFTLRTCAPVDDTPGSKHELEAVLPDGCLLRLDRIDQVDGRDPAATEVRRRTLVARDCEQTAPLNPSDQSAELPDEAVTVAGDALVVRVPREALGPFLAPGTVLRDVAARTSEATTLAPGATYGSTVLLRARAAGDRAPAPAPVVLG